MSSNSPPEYTPASLPDAETLYQSLLAAVRRMLQDLPRQAVRLVGIHSGGAWLAERLQRDLDLPGRPGTLDISFYRDDFDRIGLHSQVQPSDIPFDVADAHLVLVDDVLYTGRTIRAAMNELFDYGRPASIRLAVLLDRGGRELPIAAGAVGARVVPAPQGSLVLSRREDGGFELALEKENEDE
ncbi:bifunctional pyr operon transcriptional regulator/uracil phosphoribosyltransferase PyrR [Orrella sp. JC864]|uniref:bifunctional pyr operon transcriptional regulator/uracil phosphoribosyltransferase PyrR n=1 Tax=Orrella sp. JC864 TaxID=3120298 RepID=UPI0030099879